MVDKSDGQMITCLSKVLRAPVIVLLVLYVISTHSLALAVADNAQTNLVEPDQYLWWIPLTMKAPPQTPPALPVFLVMAAVH
jgi:hypothetical protein